MKARWKLEEEASHSRSKHVGNVPEVAHQHLCPTEPLNVRNQLRSFDREDEFPTFCLSDPRLHRRGGRPRVKRCVEFNGFEMLRIVLEPLVRRKRGGVESTSPMPIKPT